MQRRPRRAVDGILLLDKPLGISSNDALQRAKRIFRAAKAGHTGSLDPLATGVLPLCFGEATKLCGVLLESDKRYLAHARLGARTTTGDAEGEIIERSDTSAFTRETLEAVLPGFLGPIQQIPPMYSALKHQGRPLYALAREGAEIERQPRTVTIHALTLHGFLPDGFELEVHCSKGTYIRTLVEDLARAAGQQAHLVGLRRTAVTPFDAMKPIGFSELEAAAAQSEAVLDALLMTPAHGLAHWPSVRVEAMQAAALAQGKVLAAASVPGLAADPTPRLAVLDQAGQLLGLAEVDGQGQLAPRRWLAVKAAPRL